MIKQTIKKYDDTKEDRSSKNRSTSPVRPSVDPSSVLYNICKKEQVQTSSPSRMKEKEKKNSEGPVLIRVSPISP